MFSSDVIPSGARDLQWNVVPTVIPEDSSPRKLRRLGMTIKLTPYQPIPTNILREGEPCGCMACRAVGLR